MPALSFEVPVAAAPPQVAARLDEAGRHPRDLINWFTDDPGVRATVQPTGDGWRIRVVGSVFTADALASVRPTGSGSVISVDGQLQGRGLFSLASPALRVAVPRVEAEARRSLQREFGAPGEAGR